MMKGYSVCSLNRRFFEEENDYTVLGNVGINIKGPQSPDPDCWSQSRVKKIGVV
jgi:hypothetical protein